MRILIEMLDARRVMSELTRNTNVRARDERAKVDAKLECFARGGGVEGRKAGTHNEY